NKVATDDRSDTCEREWVQRLGRGDIGDPVITLEAPCTLADGLTEKIIQLAAKKQENPAKPATKLLYGPNDPDRPTTGACRNFSRGDKDCEEYQEVAPPKGYEAIAAQVQQNPHVICAVFLDGVKAKVSAKLEPGVDGDRSQWTSGEPARTI